MNAQEEEFLKSLRATFKVEAAEHLQAITAGLVALGESTATWRATRQIVETVFRAAHSLKGARPRRKFRQGRIDLPDTGKHVFAAWKRQEGVPSPQEMDGLHRLLDAATEILNATEAGREEGRQPLPSPRPQAAVQLETAAPALPANQPARVETAPAEAPSSFSPGATEKAHASETVRISVGKLDAQLLQAEEMLVAKLTTSQRAADLRGLARQLEEWNKEWAAVQPEMRTLRQTSERPASSQGTTPQPAGSGRAG